MTSNADAGYFSPVGITDITHVVSAMVDNNPTQLDLFESMLLWPKEKLQGLLASLVIVKPEDLVMEDNTKVSTREKYLRLDPPLQKMVELDELA